jgi:choline dehydrogenase-like flavoprotein
LLLQGATVVELVRNSRGDRITEARWVALPAGRGAVRAGSFVIAAGAIESARLLLLTLGERPWLGRGFMEHLLDGSLRLLSHDPALLIPAGFYAPRRAPSGVPVLGRLGFAPEFLRAERLRNASIRLRETTEPALLQSPRLRPLARRLVPLPALRRLIGDGVRKVASLTRAGRPLRYQLLIDLEQGPHPENRVLLSSHRDLLGLPQARLHWRLQPEDLVHAARVRALVASDLERAGAGRVVSSGPLPLDPKQHHHAGTTRMHRDPALGVVDESLRVHGMENLFVAGSAVFPTAGVANPTLTVVALALRLAAELASR